MGAATDLAKALIGFATAVEKNGTTTKYTDHFGWQSPAVDRTDIGNNARILAERIETIDWTKSDDTVLSLLTNLATKVDVATATQAPNIHAGFAGPAAALSFLYSIQSQIENQVEPFQIKTALFVPVTVARAAKLAQQRLNESMESIDSIEAVLLSINAAHQAAENLPVTQDELEEAVRDLRAAKVAATASQVAAAESAREADLHRAAAAKVLVEANASLARAEDAYRAATSQGLAAAFKTKSDALNMSMFLWVGGLIFALGTAGAIGAWNFPHVLAVLGTKPDWGVVAVNMLLGTMLMAPAIWLAWVATKQIGQRFRLSEDYGYKAALAAAYEGYRAEAVKLDPLLQSELFGIALGRLDEIPLRLIEPDVYGSPLHELLHTREFKDALLQVPDLKQRVLAVLTRRDTSLVAKDAGAS